MKGMVIPAIAIIGVVIFVVSCIAFYGRVVQTQTDMLVTQWISSDGVHYWAYSDGNRYGLAPRYDNVGKLVINKEVLNEQID